MKNVNNLNNHDLMMMTALSQKNKKFSRPKPEYTDQHNNRLLNFIYNLYKKISKFVF